MQNDSQLPNPDWLNSAVGALEASITRAELQPGNERYCARLNEAIAALNQFAHQSAQLQQLGGRVALLESALEAITTSMEVELDLGAWDSKPHYKKDREAEIQAALTALRPAQEQAD